MKNIFCSFLCLFCVFLYAQDSIPKTVVVANKHFNYKQLLLPATLVAVGGVLKINYLQNSIQHEVRNTFGSDYHTQADNYLQFVPAAQLLLGNSLGFQSKHGCKQMLANAVLSNVLVGGVSFVSKTIAHDQRPDYTAYNSFPSGHTATAFNNATLLFLEYKDSNFWYASSGYLFAASTAVLRTANNRHWAGDVFAGAGIGIAIATVVNYWNPFHFDTQNNKSVGLIGYPILNDKNYGFGLVYQIK